VKNHSLLIGTFWHTDPYRGGSPELSLGGRVDSGETEGVNSLRTKQDEQLLILGRGELAEASALVAQVEGVPAKC
jgi:hypothetical protein